METTDLEELSYLPDGQDFLVGPLVDTHHENSLEWLADLGARRIRLPPELPPESVAVLAKAGARLCVIVEVWAHGRTPFAIAGRCERARLHSHAKDVVGSPAKRTRTS